MSDIKLGSKVFFREKNSIAYGAGVVKMIRTDETIDGTVRIFIMSGGEQISETEIYQESEIKDLFAKARDETILARRRFAWSSYRDFLDRARAE